MTERFMLLLEVSEQRVADTKPSGDGHIARSHGFPGCGH